MEVLFARNLFCVFNNRLLFNAVLCNNRLCVFFVKSGHTAFCSI